MATPHDPRARRRFPRPATVGLFALAALAFIRFSPTPPASAKPFGADGVLFAGPSPNAFGASRNVKLRFALPGDEVEFPLDVNGDPSLLAYEWVPVRDSVSTESARPLSGSLVAPTQPGFYHLVVVNGTERQELPEPTLAVMVPFSEKRGAVLNGYRIGTYVGERVRGATGRPPGFIEVHPADLELKVSRHLRLADFITHDSQTDVWPKYVALNPRLLDKIELVLSRILIHSGIGSVTDSAPQVAFDVHSGFRTPAYNRGVTHAARDSRHQYGDAVDLAIDADGDGRVTAKDGLLVARAVDEIEREFPELVGGLGLYTSRRFRAPYVHIDARGRRTRWTG